MLRQTHTYANLAVSPLAYTEIKEKLAAAGYADTFIDDGEGHLRIPMQGIALIPDVVDTRDALNEKRDGTKRHPSIAGVLKHFRYVHLPEHLQKISRPFGELAITMADAVPEGPDLTCGLRDLLTAKDNVVRAALP